ncbi:hypothetical protein ACFRH4_08720 [Streptomyces mirabilis]|uniref:hypothetical protein n=1 Tax=Streptomyces mirabilis TaxID=68239 RepID=UPI00367A9CFF
MARTAVPYSNLVANGSLATPSGTTLDATNDHVIAAAKPELTVLVFTNTDTNPHIVTVKAGTYPPALAAGQGDKTFTVAASGSAYFGPFESGRFLQNDGSVQIDIETGHAGKVTALLVPRAT